MSVNEPTGTVPGQQWLTIGQIMGMIEEYRKVGNLSAAENLCRQILQAQPRNTEALHMLGIIMHQSGNVVAGIDLIKQAIAINGFVPLYHTNLGEMSRHAGRLEEAVAAGRRALELQPNFPQAANNLGIAYYDLERYQEAETYYRRALQLDPNFAEAHSNLGNALRIQHKAEAALASYRRALELRPAYADAMANMGSVLHMVGKIDDAIAVYQRSLALDPMQTNAHSGLGLLYLMRGRFDEGWFEYEWRLRTAEAHYQPPPGPPWEGEPLAGRRLLVQAEQGLGDTLHFCRYLPLLRARGGKVVFNVHAPVASIIAHSMPWLEVIAGTGVSQSAYDTHCALLSVPHRFGTDLSSIPGEVPYLKAREDVVARWAKRLGNSRELKVGVVTTGNPKQLHNKMRMVPIKAMRPLLQIPGVKFYSLQVGYLTGELTRYSRGAVENLAPELTDFMETAGAMENLDLVLSCCTSVVHLAGALGRPTWVMLPSVADWRWLTEREDSPWYPTVRLFRQRQATTWSDVIERVGEELRAVVAGDRARLTPFLKRTPS